ncbi:hypothetical protein TIN4_74 [Tsukamurella phage TIN4]|uniref:Uncharacterized protein n=2 Tax=Tinduovirus TIN3 TaxID=1982571 RepID=A0A0K0N5J1_9CAUD|nr:hypothetical protein AVT54_gp051 [Tsukamurella phage TIN3]YP_009604204.1 hypothetical protein FDH87_gp051 [Tsukamurella phage TIN4]AKJ71871.1 hypothetical protein TIN3_74 [Tsukamurella phage TIN3]AKJ71980.1 hypothetical protein TIN4_74 [Tsukamurella phage TIN4]
MSENGAASIPPPPPIENPERFRPTCSDCGSWINHGSKCTHCKFGKPSEQKPITGGSK